MGITRVRPLLGGLKAWEDCGFPLHDFFPKEEAKETTSAQTS
jgi:hypothetical protein